MLIILYQLWNNEQRQLSSWITIWSKGEKLIAIKSFLKQIFKKNGHLVSMSLFFFVQAREKYVRLSACYIPGTEEQKRRYVKLQSCCVKTSNANFISLRISMELSLLFTSWFCTLPHQVSKTFFVILLLNVTIVW